MTWIIKKDPSDRIVYQTWVSVWNPRLVVHAHYPVSIVDSKWCESLTVVSFSVSSPKPVREEVTGWKFLTAESLLLISSAHTLTAKSDIIPEPGHCIVCM